MANTIQHHMMLNAQWTTLFQQQWQHCVRLDTCRSTCIGFTLSAFHLYLAAPPASSSSWLTSRSCSRWQRLSSNDNTASGWHVPLYLYWIYTVSISPVPEWHLQLHTAAGWGQGHWSGSRWQRLSNSPLKSSGCLTSFFSHNKNKNNRYSEIIKNSSIHHLFHLPQIIP